MKEPEDLTPKEKDILIAEFMNLAKQNMGNGDYLYECPETGDYVEPISFKYDESYNWIIPVVVEIGNLTSWELIIRYSNCYWNNQGDRIHDDNGIEIEIEGGYENPSFIYDAVIEFLIWYKKQ